MYHVYIVTNQRNGTLYTGETSDLRKRVWQHKNKALPGFSAQYGLNRLVYFEEFRDVAFAIEREKQIKAGSRKKKLQLIESQNASWGDLASAGALAPTPKVTPKSVLGRVAAGPLPRCALAHRPPGDERTMSTGTCRA